MKKNRRKWRGFLAIVLCFVLSLSFSACSVGTNGSSSSSSDSESQSGSNVKPITPPAKTYPVGDINFDEQVDFKDVVLFRDYMFATNLYYYNKNACDIVKNGVLNMGDFRYLWNIVNNRGMRQNYSAYVNTVATGKGDVNGDGVINASDVWDWIDYYNQTQKGGWPTNPCVTQESCNITGDKNSSTREDVVDYADMDALLSMSEVNLIDPDYLTKLNRAASTLGVRALSMATETSDPDFYHQFYNNVWEQWEVLAKWTLWYLLGYFGAEQGVSDTEIPYIVYDDTTKEYFLDYDNEFGTKKVTVAENSPKAKITAGQTEATDTDKRFNNAALAIERQVVGIEGVTESRLLADADVSDFEYVTVYKEYPENSGHYVVDNEKSGYYPKFSREKLDAQIVLLRTAAANLEPEVLTQHWLMSFTTLNENWTLPEGFSYNAEYVNEFASLVALNFLEHYLSVDLTAIDDYFADGYDLQTRIDELTSLVTQVEIDTTKFNETFLSNYIKTKIIGESVINNDKNLGEVNVNNIINYSYNKYNYTLGYSTVDDSLITNYGTSTEQSTDSGAENVIITFDSQGGTNVDFQTADGSGHISKPADPTKPDREFIGWFTAAEGGDLIDFDTHTFDANTTLYAHWGVVTSISQTSETISASVEVRPACLPEGFKLISQDYTAVVVSLVGTCFAMTQKLDTQGNMVLDEQNNPIYEPHYDQAIFAEFPSYNLGLITDIDSYAFFNATAKQNNDEFKELNNIEARNYSSAIIYPDVLCEFNSTQFDLYFTPEDSIDLDIFLRVHIDNSDEIIHVASITLLPHYDYDYALDEDEDLFDYNFANSISIDLNDYISKPIIKYYINNGVGGMVDVEDYPIGNFSESAWLDTNFKRVSLDTINHNGDEITLDKLFGCDYVDFLEFVFVTCSDGSDKFKFAIEYS